MADYQYMRLPIKAGCLRTDQAIPHG